MAPSVSGGGRELKAREPFLVGGGGLPVGGFPNPVELQRTPDDEGAMDTGDKKDDAKVNPTDFSSDLADVQRMLQRSAFPMGMR